MKPPVFAPHGSPSPLLPSFLAPCRPLPPYGDYFSDEYAVDGFLSASIGIVYTPNAWWVGINTSGLSCEGGRSPCSLILDPCFLSKKSFPRPFANVRATRSHLFPQPNSGQLFWYLVVVVGHDLGCSKYLPFPTSVFQRRNFHFASL